MVHGLVVAGAVDGAAPCTVVVVAMRAGDIGGPIPVLAHVVAEAGGGYGDGHGGGGGAEGEGERHGGLEEYP